jgi:hypothetical protein
MANNFTETTRNSQSLLGLGSGWLVSLASFVLAPFQFPDDQLLCFDGVGDAWYFRVFPATAVAGYASACQLRGRLSFTTLTASL